MQVFTLINKNGLKARITNYGGRVMNLLIPDSSGKFEDVVFGYDDPETYPDSNEKYFGATIGRFGNRIGKGEFSINGTKYVLAKNNGQNCLHGGINGFHAVIWDARLIDNQTLELKYLSPDMEEGFPGNLSVRVVYCLNDENELKIEYFATTDKPTVVSLTHHSFFNLTGNPLKTINNHVLQIPADYYTPVDDGLIPTGEIAPVKNTPFDFTSPVVIGARLNSDNQQLKFGNGYDHNWVLNPKGKNGKIHLAAVVTEPESGRKMEVRTNEPGIQFYGGNFLNGKDIGKGGNPYNLRTSFCLETQQFPDCPNKPDFPSALLRPGENYYSTCIYRFSTV